MKKRILSMLLAIVMVVGLFPTHVLATECTHEALVWDETEGVLDMYDHLLTCTCGDYTEWQSHFDENRDSKCDVCGYEMTVVAIPLRLKAVDADGKEINGELYALLNGGERVGTEAYDSATVKIGEENVLSEWNSCLEGYVWPTGEVTFTADSTGNVTITSGNATVETDDTMTYIVIELEADPSGGEDGLPALPDEVDGKIIVLMADEYGDGWNGAAIRVYKNDILAGTATVESDFSDIFEMWYDSSAEYRFAWVKGSFDHECTYAIYVDGVKYTGGIDTESPLSVTITGDPVVGQTLTAVAFGFEPGAELTYQWYRSAENTFLIEGATGSTYTLTKYDLGYGIYCMVNDKVRSNSVGAVIASGAIWVGGVQLTAENTTINGDTGTATFTPAKGETPATLTLNNYTYTGAGYRWVDTSGTTYGAAIYYGGSEPLNLVLVGTNSVKHTDADSDGVHANGDITVSGEGSLTAEGGDSGVYALSGSITVSGGSLTANGTGNGSAGVRANNITVSGGSLTGTGHFHGMFVNGSITVSGGSLSGTGRLGSGVEVNGPMTVSGGEVVAQGNSRAFLKAPTIADTFANAAVWHGESEAAATAAGPWVKSAIESSYNQKYVKIAASTEELAIPYPLWVGGKQFASKNLTINGGDGTATYDPESNTLTLNNYTYKGEGYGWNDTYYNTYGAALYYGGSEPLNLVLVGENSVIYNGYASMSYGVYAENGSINVSGDGSLTAAGGTATADFISSYGVYGVVTISGGEVVAQGKNEAFWHEPTIADTFENAAVWYGESEAAATGPWVKLGIQSNYNQKYVRIAGAEEPAHINFDLWVGGVQVTSENVKDVLEDGTVSYDPSTNTLTLNGATITGAELEADDGWSYLVGIFAEGSLTLELSGENTIMTGDGSKTRGIYVSPIYDEDLNPTVGGDLTIRGTGSLIITAGKADMESYGIYAASLALESGDVTATGGEASYSYGVQADSITISGGSLTATGGKADSISYGVQASHSITVSGGSLEATGGDTGEYGSSYGVKNGSTGLSIVLSGGSLEAIGRKGMSSVGVEADSITVSGGSLTARSDFTGTEYMMNFGVTANVTISGGEIVAQGGGKAFDFGKSLTIDEAFTHAMVWYSDSLEDQVKTIIEKPQSKPLEGLVRDAGYIKIATAIQLNWDKQRELTVRNYEKGENDVMDMIIMVAGYTGGRMNGCQVIEEEVKGKTVIPLTVDGDTLKVFFLEPGTYVPLTVCQTKDMTTQNQ